MTRDNKKKLVEKAILKFGLTDDPFEAGYIIEDGTMLDFSGKNQGMQEGCRNLEHNEIINVFKDEIEYDNAKYEFILKANAIRISLRRNRDLELSLCVNQNPTERQWQRLSDITKNRKIGVIYNVFDDSDNMKYVINKCKASTIDMLKSKIQNTKEKVYKGIL